MVDVLKEVPNNFQIRKVQEQYVLVVVCGHVGTFDIEVLLDDTLALSAIKDPSVLNSLLNDIRENPSKFKNKLKLI